MAGYFEYSQKRYATIPMKKMSEFHSHCRSPSDDLMKWAVKRERTKIQKIIYPYKEILFGDLWQPVVTFGNLWYPLVKSGNPW